MNQDKNHCNLCKRLLDQKDDQKSLDCGGDCLGCIQEIEREMRGDDIETGEINEN